MHLRNFRFLVEYKKQWEEVNELILTSKRRFLKKNESFLTYYPVEQLFIELESMYENLTYKSKIGKTELMDEDIFKWIHNKIVFEEMLKKKEYKVKACHRKRIIQWFDMLEKELIEHKIDNLK